MATADNDAYQEIDTTNDYLVGVQGDSIVVTLPIHGRLDRMKAIRLSVWLAELADPEMVTWGEVAQAVRGT